MFFVSKVLAWLLDPVLWIIVLACFLFFKTKKHLKTKQKIVIGILLALCYLFSTPIWASLMLNWQLPVSELPMADTHYDVIVVLGGSVDPGQSSVQIKTGESAERLYEAMRLQKLGYAPLVMLSGGSGSLADPLALEAPVMARWYTQLGMDKDKLLLEARSRNTAENAQNVVSIMKGRNFSRALIITSALHARRAQLHFEIANQVSEHQFSWYIVDNVSETLSFPSFLLPSSQSLWRTGQAAREMTAWCLSALFH